MANDEPVKQVSQDIKSISNSNGAKTNNSRGTPPTRLVNEDNNDHVKDLVIKKDRPTGTVVAQWTKAIQHPRDGHKV